MSTNLNMWLVAKHLAYQMGKVKTESQKFLVVKDCLQSNATKLKYGAILELFLVALSRDRTLYKLNLFID